jgi:transcriptional regulator with XRE-family HTH domain
MINPQDTTNRGSLGQRMRARRQQKGWTQEQLARQAGTNQAVIQKIENGKSLRPRKINEIAEVLGVNPAWLMFGEDAESNLSPDAIAVAEEWSQLSEPHRTRIRQEIHGLSQRSWELDPSSQRRIG